MQFFFTYANIINRLEHVANNSMFHRCWASRFSVEDYVLGAILTIPFNVNDTVRQMHLGYSNREATHLVVALA